MQLRPPRTTDNPAETTKNHRQSSPETTKNHRQSSRDHQEPQTIQPRPPRTTDNTAKTTKNHRQSSRDHQEPQTIQPIVTQPNHEEESPPNIRRRARKDQIGLSGSHTGRPDAPIKIETPSLRTPAIYKYLESDHTFLPTFVIPTLIIYITRGIEKPEVVLGPAKIQANDPDDSCWSVIGWRKKRDPEMTLYGRGYGGSGSDGLRANSPFFLHDDFLKKELKGKRFDSDEDVQKVVQDFFHTLPKSAYKE
ncbi:hypothetical protein LAZ67_7003379 [Cordylochernes scorpioides]|uniref:Uncharacterized protein n=1 Tax=Cordylochernes scorpioides TaxID=51811 RepID=A0ABY6KNT1_9ARAC|nr:hypothetical protein LAZ67_7003379 [Cordylochernes scorpioides]